MVSALVLGRTSYFQALLDDRTLTISSTVQTFQVQSLTQLGDENFRVIPKFHTIMTH